MEPNHPMDELLKAYARQRRAQAGPPAPLHPATRNLLKAEVERTFRNPTPETPTRSGTTWSLWTRLLAGACCLGVLLLGIGLWLEWHDDSEVASLAHGHSNLFLFAGTDPERRVTTANESNELAERVRRFELAASAPSAPPTAARERGQSVPSAQPASDLLALSPAAGQASPEPDMISNSPRLARGLGAGPAVPPQKAKVESLERSGIAENAAGLLSTATALPADTNETLAERKPLALTLADMPGRPTLAAPVTLRTEAGVVPSPTSRFVMQANQRDLARTAAPTQTGLYFQQVAQRAKYRNNLNSPPMPNVLTGFQFQVAGPNVQVIDWDGSVYEGTIENALARYGLAKRPEPRQQAIERASPASAQLLEAQQSFMFRVAGTNNTLNQRVIFSGQFNGAGAAMPGQASKSPATGRPLRGAGAAVQGQAPGRGMSAQQGTIEGNAIVGDTNQFRIQAQQVAP